MPVRQSVLSLSIQLRLLLASGSELVTPVLEVVRCMLRRHLLGQPGLVADQGHGGAVTLIRPFRLGFPLTNDVGKN